MQMNMPLPRQYPADDDGLGPVRRHRDGRHVHGDEDSRGSGARGLPRSGLVCGHRRQRRLCVGGRAAAGRARSSPKVPGDGPTRRIAVTGAASLPTTVDFDAGVVRRKSPIAVDTGFEFVSVGLPVNGIVRRNAVHAAVTGAPNSRCASCRLRASSQRLPSSRSYPKSKVVATAWRARCTLMRVCACRSSTVATMALPDGATGLVRLWISCSRSTGV